MQPSVLLKELPVNKSEENKSSHARPTLELAFHLCFLPVIPAFSLSLSLSSPPCLRVTLYSSLVTSSAHDLSNLLFFINQNQMNNIQDAPFHLNSNN